MTGRAVLGASVRLICRPDGVAQQMAPDKAMHSHGGGVVRGDSEVEAENFGALARPTESRTRHVREWCRRPDARRGGRSSTGTPPTAAQGRRSGRTPDSDYRLQPSR